MARFMRWYPAYTLQGVLNEYAVTFYALLNEGYRLRYDDALLTAQLNDYPLMDRSAKQELNQQLRWASTHPSDILDDESAGSSPDEIKRLLNG